MKIMVLAKQVPDTWQERTLDMETGMLVRDGAAEPVPDEISERVMEVALQYKDSGADVEIVAMTMGPEDATKTLRKMLAMGADAAVHVAGSRFVVLVEPCSAGCGVGRSHRLSPQSGPKADKR